MISPAQSVEHVGCAGRLGCSREFGFAVLQGRFGVSLLKPDGILAQSPESKQETVLWNAGIARRRPSVHARASLLP